MAAFILKSKFRSRCPACGSYWEVGTAITKHTHGQWVHLACATRSAEPTPPASQHAPEQQPSFTPSPYQAAIFDWIQQGQGNAFVESCAGSGKTTTVVRALSYIPATASTLNLAFNKHIVAELVTRTPAYVQNRTFHSLGFHQLRRNFGNALRFDENKVPNILDTYADFRVEPEMDESTAQATAATRSALLDLVDKIRFNLTDYNDKQAVEEIIERYGLVFPDKDLSDSAQAKLPEIMYLIAENRYTADYADLLWLPVACNLPLQTYDWIFVDELQDMNTCQREFLRRCCHARTRVVGVGDPNQSINGFAGADAESVPAFVREFNAQVFPLSVTYRCPQSHVRLAQTLVPSIEAAPGAKEGRIKYIETADLLENIRVGDMVLCRTNAPLVGPALRLLRQGIAVVIKGNDIGATLTRWARRIKGGNIREAKQSLAEVKAKEVSRLVANKASASALQYVVDMFEVLHELLAECSRPSDLIPAISSLFKRETDSDAAQARHEVVTFSSVHRSKGLEADRVFILRPDLMPMRSPDQKLWEAVQEKNLQYVAWTRAKKLLVFVRDPEAEEKKNKAGRGARED